MVPTAIYKIQIYSLEVEHSHDLFLQLLSFGKCSRRTVVTSRLKLCAYSHTGRARSYFWGVLVPAWGSTKSKFATGSPTLGDKMLLNKIKGDSLLGARDLRPLVEDEGVLTTPRQSL